jgi:hypothetical protein
MMHHLVEQHARTAISHIVQQYTYTSQCVTLCHCNCAGRRENIRVLIVRTNAEAKANDFKLPLIELENGDLLDDDQQIRITRQVT